MLVARHDDDDDDEAWFKHTIRIDLITIVMV